MVIEMTELPQRRSMAEAESATHEADAGPILNTGMLTDIAAILKPQDLSDLIDMFIADTETQLADIATLRARNDLPGIAAIGHNIVSTAGNLGATRASILARQLERKCRQGEMAGSYRLISELARACDMASVGMRAWLKEWEAARTAKRA